MPKPKPIAYYGFLQLPDCVLTERVPVGGEVWRDWMEKENVRLFGVETSSGTFTAKKEDRKDGAYWYAYKRRDGRLRKLYIGRDEDLDQMRLSDVCYQINLSDAAFWSGRSASPTPPSDAKNLVTTSRADLEAIAAELLQDDAVTRGGRDRGSVRRGLDAMIKRLTECASAPK